jgi:hypothetical protein
VVDGCQVRASDAWSGPESEFLRPTGQSRQNDAVEPEADTDHRQRRSRGPIRLLIQPMERAFDGMMYWVASEYELVA